MGELWRSKEMSLVEIFIPLDVARSTIGDLGQRGIIQFKDLNHGENSIHRNFSEEVKRADELYRKLSFFESQIKLYNQEVDEWDRIEVPVEDNVDLEQIQIETIEESIFELERDLNESIYNLEKNIRSRNAVVEFNHVLANDDRFFLEYQSPRRHSEKDLLLEDDHEEDIDHGFKVGHITGVIDREKFHMFERVLFRVTRGNLYWKFSEIEEDIKDPTTGKLVKKNVFIIFFKGDVLGKKIQKLCETYGTVYNCPEDQEERRALIDQYKNTLVDIDLMIEKTKQNQYHILTKVSGKLNLWKKKVIREKAIFHTMNLFRFDRGNKCLIAEGWVPTESLEELHISLRSVSDSQVSSHYNVLDTKETPPTYFPVNKYTSIFQDIINAYGVPRYREINPAVFTIITFPFMFGVMFGDVGHGILLLIASIFLILKEKQWKGKKLNDMIQPAFEGRYVLLLMSLFAIYCGFIYNEMFSVPMNLFGTNWKISPGDRYYEPKSLTRTYPFGVDPVWKGAGNELMFYNSFKMKMSIIVGVIHMMLGMVLKFINSIYTRNDLDIFFECLPGSVLMLSLFGYMCFMMFYKWSIPYYYNEVNGYEPTTKDAPQILSMMIYMFLSPFKNPPDMVPLFPSQGKVQGFLVILAVLSVPLMLIPKPFILRSRHRKRQLEVGFDEDEEEFNFSEEMVHQVIETIEFALGSISSTASYLRLWALSLAHSELSTVFWDLGFVQLGLSFGPFVLTFIVFGLWAGVTLAIIMVMETLSAFLHSLRLHWVEFQGKFYKADGVLFCPLSFEAFYENPEGTE